MDWLVNILNERSFTNEQQCTIERYIKILFHENMKWYVNDQWNDKCIWNKIGFGNETVYWGWQCEILEVTRWGPVYSHVREWDKHYAGVRYWWLSVHMESKAMSVSFMVEW